MVEEDGVGGELIREEVGYDDHGHAWFDEVEVAEVGGDFLDGLFHGEVVEVHGEGAEAAAEGELAADFDGGCEGVEALCFGAEHRGLCGEGATACDDDEVGGVERIHEGDGGAHGFLAFFGEFDEFAEAEGRLFGVFAAFGDAVHGVDALDGVVAGGGFAGEHDGVCFFLGGVHDVCDLGACRRGVGDHGLEHVGGDDDAGGELVAPTDDASLEEGKFFEVDFDAEVTASDHDDVGGFDDGVEVADGFLVFEFGDEFGFAAEFFHFCAEFADVSGVTDEGAGDEVCAAFDCEFEVAVVFFGECGEVEACAWKVDVAS